jgi:Fe-S-cluster containining protein
MRCKKCGKCCEGTLMELSTQDLQRLEQANHLISEFAERSDDGIWRLQNVEGHCVFLEPKGAVCAVYALRPLGCYIYPLNLGPDGTMMVDTICPAGDSLTAKEKKKKGALLRRHLREIDTQAKQK